MIEQLYELLNSIPNEGAFNIARRMIIIKKIAELEAQEGVSNDD